MEDLRNLKFNVLNNVKKDWRVKLNLLAYKKLQRRIEYELNWYGLKVHYVSPRSTSSICPRCGNKLISNGYRKMKCIKCGFETDRDTIACLNILKKFNHKWEGHGSPSTAPEGDESPIPMKGKLTRGIPFQFNIPKTTHSQSTEPSVTLSVTSVSPKSINLKIVKNLSEIMYTPMIYGYDRAITIFSPEGELYQVRYAGEAVKRGWATLGLKCAGGVVLAAEKRKLGPLIDLNSIEKIYMIDEHVGIAPSGLLADARVLIEYARQEAQIHRLIYDEPIDVELLTRRISDLKQIYTQHGGVRPFGAALIIGGVDRHGPKLFQTDPGGIYFGYYATAIGSGASTIMDFLEKNYRYDITLEEGIKLALKALSLVIEALEPDRVEVAAIDSKTRRYRKLLPDEVKLIIDEIRKERTSS